MILIIISFFLCAFIENQKPLRLVFFLASLRETVFPETISETASLYTSAATNADHLPTIRACLRCNGWHQNIRP